jgi:hypothetical protein
MRVFSINPNTNKYFEDISFESLGWGNVYYGSYNYTPIYPRYTFTSSGRIGPLSINNNIKFYTMLRIKKGLEDYLVEVNFTFTLSEREEKPLEEALKAFYEFCDMNKNKLDVENLVN